MTKKKTQRTFDARPDTTDFRDKMYTANLCEVPTKIDLEEYLQYQVPILDQGQEGACTGFGLATVANYLLRKRKHVPDQNSVSARMIYEMARRYDEWPGEQYSGSSARGAMKGWQKHGICGNECWPYDVNDQTSRLNEARTSDALKRPLGAYYRVNHQDIVAMHAAMAEVGVLYATGNVHSGWYDIKKDGLIPFTQEALGGHAFAIVAYDERGFWIQNSWGHKWGKLGFAQISYDDWLVNATDTWVARLGAPITLNKVGSTAIAHSASAGKSSAYSYADLRPHIVCIGNQGRLRAGGDFGTTAAEVQTIFQQDFKRVTKDWKKKKIMLYAHGGLVSEQAAVQRLAEYRIALLASEVYPISFIWKSDAWTTITNILQDAIQRRKPEGILDAAKDFMLDRLDDALEPLARTLSGKLQWDEMKENARLATEAEDGGALFALLQIADLAKEYGDKLEIHIVGHSAGSIFHAPLIRLLTAKGKISSGYLKGKTGFGLKVKTCTLWAPACTVDLFKEAYLPSIHNNTIEKFTLFTMTDEAEQDDNCGYIYNKSLLYLVANAFEEKARIPVFRSDGTPILGMEKFIKKDEELSALFEHETSDWIRSPNTKETDPINYSTSRAHGDFDDDGPTVKSTLARICGSNASKEKIKFSSSASFLAGRRKQLNRNGR